MLLETHDRAKKTPYSQLHLSPIPRFLLVVVLAIGLFFRFANLDGLVYSYDESYTSLRISGHTRAELLQQDWNGSVMSVGEFREKYQTAQPDRDIADTVQGLAVEEAQLTPLYFVVAKLWVGIFGSSISAVRSLSGVVSLLIFPCAFWLCIELFGAAWIGWLAIALMAVSPFHFLYAKDARPYILLAAFILLASAVLLWTLRNKKITNWLIYSLTAALGLYTHLLFAPVMIGHGFYVLVIQGFRLSRTVLAYTIASLTSVVLFTPWIATMLTHSLAVANKLEKSNDSFGLNSIIGELKPLSRYSCRIFVDTHWAGGIVSFGEGHPLNQLVQPGVGVAILGLIAYSLYYLYRTTPTKTWLFVGLLIIGTPFMLLIKDGITDRYLFAYYLGIQLAVAYFLAAQFMAKYPWQQILGKVVLVALLTGGIISGIMSSQANLWTIKFPSSSGSHPAIAQILNQAENPLLIVQQPNIPFTGSADKDSFGRLMSLSHLLNSNVQLQLLQQPETLKISPQFHNIFLYRPTRALREHLEQAQYQVKPLEPVDAAWLWQVVK
jgi:uncharacterized membrane protein